MAKCPEVAGPPQPSLAHGRVIYSDAPLFRRHPTAKLNDADRQGPLPAQLSRQRLVIGHYLNGSFVFRFTRYISRGHKQRHRRDRGTRRGSSGYRPAAIATDHPHPSRLRNPFRFSLPIRLLLESGVRSMLVWFQHHRASTLRVLRTSLDARNARARPKCRS